MTQYEREYELGRKAFLEHLPFKSNRSIAWQNGWIDAREYRNNEKEFYANTPYDEGSFTLNENVSSSF